MPIKFKILSDFWLLTPDSYLTLGIYTPYSGYLLNKKGQTSILGNLAPGFFDPWTLDPLAPGPLVFRYFFACIP
jgi:hypothetical protein